MNASVSNDFHEFLDIARRRRTVAIVGFAAIFLVAAGLALFLPPVYKSQATILIEQQEIPSDFVRSTVTSYADQRIQVISQRVMTSQNLGEIIEKYDLYADERQREAREVILEEMRDDIDLEMISADVVDPRSGRPTEATIAFSLSYKSEYPDLAQKVTNELVTLFLNENLRSRAEMAEQTASFLDDEANKLESQVEELEKKLAQFKEENIEALPELLERNYSVRDRTEADLETIQQQIDAIRERSIMIEAQLAQVAPYETAIGEDGRRILTPADRLKALRTELVAATSRYGDSHPDVKRLRKEVKALEADVGEGPDVGTLSGLVDKQEEDLRVLRQTYAEAHPEVQAAERALQELRTELAAAQAQASEEADAGDAVKPTNPAYIQLQGQLETARAELRAALDRRRQLEQKVEEVEGRLFRSAAVEGEYRSLMRDYETALLKFQEFSAKRLEADVSESLEREQKGERFTLIEPPLRPEEPSAPNRWAIFLVGLALSLGGGGGAATLAEAIDDRVYGRRGIAKVMGAPPIAIIPAATSGRGAGARTRKAAMAAMAVVAVAAIGLLAVHLWVKPIDVIWYTLLRKI